MSFVFPHLLALSTLDLAPHPQNDCAPKTPSSPEALTDLPIELTSTVALINLAGSPYARSLPFLDCPARVGDP